MNKEGVKFSFRFTTLSDAGIEVYLEGPTADGSPALQGMLATSGAIQPFVELVQKATSRRYDMDEGEPPLFWLVRPEVPWPQSLRASNATGLNVVTVTAGVQKQQLGHVTCATAEDAASVATVFADFFRRLTGFERSATVIGGQVGAGRVIRQRTLFAPPPPPPKPHDEK